MTSIDSENLRFSSDGNCRACCLDQIIIFFDKQPLPKKVIQKVTNSLQTATFFRHLNMQYTIYIPWISMFSPLVWWLYLIHRNNVTFSLKAFNEKINSQSKKCILHHLTFYQLYGISERWTHCVVEFFAQSSRSYYDGYLNILEKEYPNMYSYKPPSHGELVDYLGIKILITE